MFGSIPTCDNYTMFVCVYEVIIHHELQYTVHEFTLAMCKDICKGTLTCKQEIKVVKCVQKLQTYEKFSKQ